MELNKCIQCEHFFKRINDKIYCNKANKFLNLKLDKGNYYIKNCFMDKKKKKNVKKND